MHVRTRFAPSPTGYLHIGGTRTALFSWLQAQKQGGRFILRIEDTDRERSTQVSVDAILEGMAWLGLTYDEGPFYQTQRFGHYQEAIDKLLSEGKAYRCYCTQEELDSLRKQQLVSKEKPRYDGRCRHRIHPKDGVEPVVRFKNPATGNVIVNDLVRGRVIFKNSELDDLIIARSNGTPTYNFCVVVDDMDMGISHVIRGDDHLNNTPRQMNIMQALRGVPPIYAHVPMILDSDGQRLSKRHGAVSVLQYREAGYLPEALLNYLVRLGWSHQDEEIISIEKMKEWFDVKDVNRAASAFDQEKLLWLNHQYIMNLPVEKIVTHLQWHFQQLGIECSKGPDLGLVIRAQRERSKTLKEMAERSRFLFEDFAAYDEKAAQKNLRGAVQAGLQQLRQGFETLNEWSPNNIHQEIVDTAKQFGMKMGKLAQPLRVAVSGGTASPPIDLTLQLLGRDRTLQRIDRALNFIRERMAQEK